MEQIDRLLSSRKQIDSIFYVDGRFRMHRRLTDEFSRLFFVQINSNRSKIDEISLLFRFLSVSLSHSSNKTTLSIRPKREKEKDFR